MDNEIFKRLSKRVSQLEEENEALLDRVDGLTRACREIVKRLPKADRAEDVLFLEYKAGKNRIRPLLPSETEDDIPATVKLAMKIEEAEARNLRLVRQNATLERRRLAAERAARKLKREGGEIK